MTESRRNFSIYKPRYHSVSFFKSSLKTSFKYFWNYKRNVQWIALFTLWTSCKPSLFSDYDIAEVQIRTSTSHNICYSHGNTEGGVRGWSSNNFQNAKFLGSFLSKSWNVTKCLLVLPRDYSKYRLYIYIPLCTVLLGSRIS